MSRLIGIILLIMTSVMFVPSIYAQGPTDGFGKLVEKIWPKRSVHTQEVRIHPRPTWTLPDPTRRVSPRPTKTVQEAGNTTREQSISEGLQRFVTRIINSFQNRSDNYKAFLEKVKVRRDKLAEMGKDITRLNAFITTAASKVENVDAAISLAKADFSGYDFSSEPSVLRETIRTHITDIRSAFTQLHNSMSEIVVEIRNNSTVQENNGNPQHTKRPAPSVRQQNPNGRGNSL